MKNKTENQVDAAGAKVVKGNHGFIFEFKVRDGVLLFIRYRDGEREFAGRTERIFFGLAEKEFWPSRIEQGLRPFTGAGQRVLNFAKKLI